MLFHSSIRRELARSFGATLLVLFTIVITMLLVRTLGLANKGSVNPQEIMQVLTYTVLGRLPTVLTLALFIAIVSTLSRMYRDSEMAIWFSCGQGLLAFLRPVLRFSWPILLAITLMVLFVWPWANQQTEELKDRYEQRGDLERIAPGQFQESASGRRVFFIEKDNADDAEGHNIFISTTEKDGRETITSARSGRVEWVGDTKYLLLSQGQRLEQSGKQDEQSLKVSEFAEYGIQIGQARATTDNGQNLKSTPTLELLGKPGRAEAGELGWRIGMGLTAINFMLLALAVSAGNPRAGRSGNLIFMLFAFVFYYNLLNIGQSWVGSGKVQLLPFMAVLHGGVMALSLLWLLKRHYNFRLWPGRRAAQQQKASA
ncbi:MAG TPA: LPS export ABC transporter permease LptF [Macromonas sp.]|nr:LPS export ABC transporter permease LptF [Macromonas sp.]